MAIEGKITSLYTDKTMSEALLPRTNTKAITDDKGINLNAILDQVAYISDVDPNTYTAPLNADTLGGFTPDNYASKSYVSNAIANAQLGGGDGEVDLSGFATKDDISILATKEELNAINFPVDSVNGKTGTITLTAADVGAQPEITGLTNSMVMICNADGKITTSSNISTGELGYLNGVTSAIQTQLDNKEPAFDTLSIDKGGTGATTAKGASSKIFSDMNETDAALTDASMILFKYSNPTTSTGAVFYKKAPLLYDYVLSKLNLSDLGINASTTELNYIAGTTSKVQTQLNKKIPKITKLWTNASPSSSFSEQTLTITGGLSDYDFIIIRYRTYKTNTNGNAYGCTFIKTSAAGIIETISNGGKYRGVTPIADTGVKIGNLYEADDTVSTNNDFIIPYEIYGCDLI